jgi:hypothetical protein
MNASPSILICILLTTLSLPVRVVPQSASDPARPHEAAGNPDKAPVTPSAGIVSDTMGVDFGPYLAKVVQITRASWMPLIPKPSDLVTHKSARALIRVSILPNGRLEAHSMVLEERSGNVSLDRAAWGAIVTPNYPPLPVEFKSKRLVVRIAFLYDEHGQPYPAKEPQQSPSPPNS